MDGVLLVLVLAFAVRGWVRGVLSQLFAALGMFAGVWVAGWVSQWVGGHWLDARPAVVFFLLRMLVVLLSAIAVASVFAYFGDRAREATRDGPLGALDGPGGLVLGAGFGAAFVAVIVVAFLLVPWPRAVPDTVARARFAAPLMDGAARVCELAGSDSPGWHWLHERFRQAERRALDARARA